MTRLEQFESKVIRQEGCWDWSATKDARGYGRVMRHENGRNICLHAHRISYELFVGAIPEGMCVLHHCDNPSCTNPAHLFLGTRADNNRDMREKHRNRRGDRHHWGRLPDETIESIRARRNSGLPQHVVARLYGVSQAYVSMLWSGERRAG